jgi:hypothetical protein
MTVIVGRWQRRTLSALALCAACDRAPVDVLRTRSVGELPILDAGHLDARVVDARPPQSDARSDAARPRETTCDGIDNDGDGIIDNVDVANDGICDCLKIATLGTALYPMDDTFDAWLTAQSGGVVALNSETITPELLAPIDVLIVQDVRARAYEPAEIDALTAWVAAGGGLFTLTGYVADANTNVNALLAPYGIQYGTALVLVNPFANESLPVDVWYDHPVTRGISKIGVVSGYAVLGSGSVLAEGNDVLLGPVVMMRATQYQSGRVLVWGDEWITYNSEWEDRPDYQVLRLWQNALEWLGPENSCQLRSY